MLMVTSAGEKQVANGSYEPVHQGLILHVCAALVSRRDGKFHIFLFYHITQTDLIHPMFNSLMIQAWEWTPSFPT